MNAFKRLTGVTSQLLQAYKNQVPRRYFNERDDGGMRTTINSLNKDDANVMYINAVSTMGFQLSNLSRILGPVIIFPRTAFHWNVKDTTFINEESLSLFSILEPKLDILIIGADDRQMRDTTNIYQFCRKYKINVEILDVFNACTTYNFLASERRFVAAALIPPKELKSKNIYLKSAEHDAWADRENVLLKNDHLFKMKTDEDK